MSELEPKDMPEFITEFEQKTSGKSSHEIALMVWRFSNKRWADGYNQGKDDPDFERTEI